ncbi:cation:proton antiporter [Nocardia terpenica]|uniref:cation:proton antiporter domain-containing protein n=1 Tax=Nocardia terpenica TaxID=455432 RepID=UPI0018949E82|nr:cation:proton antiporter [Nocardia terpenica]MBF6064669.1 cation:proton antiporter [Nocardia terpenica]MBF6107185.1 cation:proton antiporter [Nocardia terpenica]MBF6114943.1 cation:proton antiporter [Nocardia terpenica]MBF6122048.1 cation:proton antiporter [Nocardia terpenica]MBF6154431.1 cation:proton antiporter [Nocardia terpenica]
MSDVAPFALALLIVAVAGSAAVLSHRLGERFPIPVSALFLLGAAAASDVWPWLQAVPIDQVERVVTVALVVILFDGGMQLGWRRVRANAGVIVWLGAAGTLLTAVAVAVAAHVVFGLDWRIALLLGTALSPTDPAVVFSVLGRRQIGGRTGVLLQGESGANDPVGIALLVVLLTVTHFHVGAVGSVAGAFTLQLVVGAVAGAAGGWGLLWFMRSVALPAAGLYSLRVLMGVMAIYAVTTLVHGSGFLAVLVAGIIVGDQRAPYKVEIVRFHSALSNLAEIVAFVMLGLTIQLTGRHGIIEGHALWIGLGLAVLMAVVIRPLLVGALLSRADLTRGERLFVAWTGLKGAVPILLGMFILQAGVPDARRAYEIIFVVVAFSVITQGGLVPALARRLDIPLRTVNPRPWGMNARFEEEPDSLHRFNVSRGSPAEGSTVADLPSDDLWISVIIHHGRLVTVTPDTVLHAGDEVLVLAEPDTAATLSALFTTTASPQPAPPPRAAGLRQWWLQSAPMRALRIRR